MESFEKVYSKQDPHNKTTKFKLSLPDNLTAARGITWMKLIIPCHLSEEFNKL
jgi:hypothetical protein